MMNLPEEPLLICRKCLSQIILRSFPLVCPKCGLEEIATETKVTKLIKFYPRLLTARKKLDDHGFAWESYTFKKHSMVRMYYFETLKFNCIECNKSYSVTSSRVNKFAKEPGLFCCPKCRKHPKLNKDTKEFFVSFDNVNLAANRLIKFQLDVFLPLGLHHSEYEVQAPIYENAAVE